MNIYPKHGNRILDLPAWKRKFYIKIAAWHSFELLF